MILQILTLLSHGFTNLDGDQRPYSHADSLTATPLMEPSTETTWYCI